MGEQRTLDKMSNPSILLGHRKQAGCFVAGVKKNSRLREETSKKR